jgi:uncharacterized protein
MAVDEKASVIIDRKLHQNLIDCDVHPMIDGQFGELLQYMSAPWRQKLAFMANGPITNAPSQRMPHFRGPDVYNRDATPPAGGLPASNADFVRADLLDRYKVDYALLISLQAAISSVMSTHDEHSAAVVSAFNDYFLDRWTSDARFRYALVVSPLNPELAAKEIRRHGKHPAVAAVFLPLMVDLLGHHRWHPIYEACLEFGFPIVSHPGAGDGLFDGAPRYPGHVELMVEKYLAISSVLPVHLTSLVMKGTFERYPQLKFLFVEWRFAWILAHMWDMDSGWREARIEVPWVKKWPSEYVREHMRFASQPLPDPRGPRQLEELIEGQLSDILVFSSDYPHWNSDRPGSVLNGLSGATKRKVFYDNAHSILRLE